MTPALRSAHVASCSAAAALNVSPGTSITFAPLSLANRCDSLPTVVVLPPPLTPTTNTALGSFELSLSVKDAGPLFPPFARSRMFTMAVFNPP